MAKGRTVWPTQVALHPLHVNLYTTLDLSSRAKEILRDGKDVFNFFLQKIFLPRIFAESLQLTVETDCLDIAYYRGG